MVLNYNMKLINSVSDQNIFLTYICLINDVKPSCDYNDSKITEVTESSAQNQNVELNEDFDEPIQVERSKALHELVEPKKTHKEEQAQTEAASSEANKELSRIGNDYVNPNLLKLTKMKWLTGNQDEAYLSSSPSITPTNSSCSICSRESDENIGAGFGPGEKCLSTILKLDKEHNMFGLSNITIVGRKMSKKNRKDNEKPIFPQTAIIQICCSKSCCRHKSNTDLPTSLKCGARVSCCLDPCCSICVIPPPPCDNTPCSHSCSSCAKVKSTCKGPRASSKCIIDCNTYYGMKITVNKKSTFEPAPMELTPRSSCILQKPLAARSCTHIPHCVPPSSCFPYLMPCFWPARAGAPCTHPAQCFHNPPCRPPRTRKRSIPPDEECTKGGTCGSAENKATCPNPSCPGNIPSMKEAIQSKFGKK